MEGGWDRDGRMDGVAKESRVRRGGGGHGGAPPKITQRGAF
jgi:hypothetical protein